MARLLDVTSEYVSMIETGKRPLSKKVLKKLESLSNGSGAQPCVAEAPSDYSPNSSECKYPDGCDLKAELAELKASLSDMQGKMNTLLGLLGGPLRASIGLDDTKPGKRAG